MFLTNIVYSEESNFVNNIKRLLLMLIFAALISSCGSNTPINTPGITVIVQTPQTNPSGSPVVQPSIPEENSAYPMVQPTYPADNYAYPEPSAGSESPSISATLENFTTHLVVPTPSSGKCVITGQLLIGGNEDQPYIATLYLGKTVPPSTPGYAPLISHSADTDPLAIQDVNTGRFVFSDVSPGQYAIVLWTPYGGSLLADGNGQTIMISVVENETKDLGVIPIP